MMNTIRNVLTVIFKRNRFISDYKGEILLQSKLRIQMLVACSFFVLSIANIFAKSYIMLIFTALGCVINIVFALLARSLKSQLICSLTTVLSCSVLFGYFVIIGGNDGFSCQWVVLLPLLSMVAMDFIIGLCVSAFFQAFLIIVFWTPARNLLMYDYNDQFCLRFPLFFLVTFLLGLMLTISLQKSEYNECMNMKELEVLTENARVSARIDPLTKLANRRFAYEEFDARFVGDGVPHCIVMGDIDNFKNANDTFGHEFGDEVLVLFSQCVNEILPEKYLKSRWGGEEFLFAANAPMAEVYAEVERLRLAIEKREFMCKGVPVHITITFGIAEYSGKDGLLGAISTADRRLYLGKTATKNCTVTEG